MANTEEQLGDLAGLEPKFAFLLTLGVHNRISDDDLAEFVALKIVYGERFWNHSVIIFTHGDLLSQQQQTLKSYLEPAVELVHKTLGRAKGGTMVLSNAKGADMGELRAIVEEAANVAGKCPRYTFTFTSSAPF
jgi:hypothetical protein